MINPGLPYTVNLTLPLASARRGRVSERSSSPPYSIQHDPELAAPKTAAFVGLPFEAPNSALAKQRASSSIAAAPSPPGRILDPPSDFRTI